VNDFQDRISKHAGVRDHSTRQGLHIMTAITPEDVKEQYIQDDATTHTMINQYGTKFTHLVRYLQRIKATDSDDSDTRVLIFSVFSDMLRKMTEILKAHDISTLFCSGNVHVRRKMIEAFQEEEEEGGDEKKKKKRRRPKAACKVMMLSLDNAASGTNLTAATHIILCEPGHGLKSHANAIDAQAIGRAHRQGGGGRSFPLKVVRMVTRDTVEQTLYLRNCLDSED